MRPMHKTTSFNDKQKENQNEFIPQNKIVFDKKNNIFKLSF
jgi:hypothetical protein